jgi:hypothetical protein
MGGWIHKRHRGSPTDLMRKGCVCCRGRSWRTWIRINPCILCSQGHLRTGNVWSCRSCYLPVQKIPTCSMFDLHNSIRPKQSFSSTGCLPPRVNPEVAQLWLSTTTAHSRTAASSGHPSAWETRVASHAPSPFRNRHCPFLFSPWNRSIACCRYKKAGTSLLLVLPSVSPSSILECTRQEGR